MTDREQILKVVEDYILTIGDADEKRFDSLWETTEESTFIAPSGQYNGYESIKRDFLFGVMEKNLTKRELKAKDIAIRVMGDIAVVIFYWEIHAFQKETGAPHVSQGKETQVLRKSPDGWKLTHIHYSSVKQ